MKPVRSDYLLKEAFPLIVHLSHNLQGEQAIEEADDLIGRMAEHLRRVGLMRRPRVVPGPQEVPRG